MKTSKFTDSQIMSILKQAESGTPVAALCREHGMSNATFYNMPSSSLCPSRLMPKARNTALLMTLPL